MKDIERLLLELKENMLSVSDGLKDGRTKWIIETAFLFKKAESGKNSTNKFTNMKG